MKRTWIRLAMVLGCVILPGSGDLLAADLRAHLIAALDAPGGRSEGDLSGPMADLFRTQTRSSTVVRVQVRTLTTLAQAGCARLQASLMQEDVPTSEGKQFPFVVRYELNLCRDGQPPSEGIDLEAASRVLSGSSGKD